MTDHEVQLVQRLVAEYLKSPKGQGFRGTSQEFQKLFEDEEGARKCDELRHVPDSELRPMVVMCALGPTFSTAPPAAMRDDLVQIVQKELDPEQQEEWDHLIGVVVAYGCGNWRVIAEGDSGWEHRWQPALDWVTRCVLVWMRKTVKWLRHNVLREWLQHGVNPASLQIFQDFFIQDEGDRKDELEEEDEQEDENRLEDEEKPQAWDTAQNLARQLWLGTCYCSLRHDAESDHQNDRNTVLREERCLREHRLSVWNPRKWNPKKQTWIKMTLNGFIARAVKGSQPRQ